jgi:hypothetical protein
LAGQGQVHGELRDPGAGDRWLTEGEHGVVLTEIRFPDGAVDRQVIVQEVRDGKVQEVWVYISDQYAFDERLAAAGL